MLGLANLVAQQLEDPKPRDGRLILQPICPSCKVNPKAIHPTTGCVRPYCENCKPKKKKPNENP